MFNEVIDDHITDESDVKSLNGNMTKEELDNQVPQRARRDITLMKNIGESFGNFVTGLVRRIRDPGQNLANDWFRKKRSIEVWCILHSNSFLSILIHWHHHGGCFSRLFSIYQTMR